MTQLQDTLEQRMAFWKPRLRREEEAPLGSPQEKEVASGRFEFVDELLTHISLQVDAGPPATNTRRIA